MKLKSSEQTFIKEVSNLSKELSMDRYQAQILALLYLTSTQLRNDEIADTLYLEDALVRDRIALLEACKLVRVTTTTPEHIAVELIVTALDDILLKFSEILCTSFENFSTKVEWILRDERGISERTPELASAPRSIERIREARSIMLELTAKLRFLRPS